MTAETRAALSTAHTLARAAVLRGESAQALLAIEWAEAIHASESGGPPPPPPPQLKVASESGGGPPNPPPDPRLKP